MTTQKKIKLTDLKVGMFVADLDRPWCDTPFPIQGFYIKSIEDVKDLAKHCRFVIIDRARTRELEQDKETEQGKQVKKALNDEVLAKLDTAPLKVKDQVVYEIQTSFQKEMKTAKKVYENIEIALRKIRTDFGDTQVENIVEVKKATDLMVKSVIRNPDAILLLSKMAAQKNEFLQCVISASALGLVFGRHIGLTEDKLQNLALGILFAKVGQLKRVKSIIYTPKKIEYRQRSFSEMAKQYDYIRASLEMTSKTGLMNKKVAEVICHHREHFDGSGFPNKYAGKKIPLLARMATIVINYEELTSPGPVSFNSTDALAKLYTGRGKIYQSSLLEAFIQSVGLYPPGSAVQLNDGRVGFVTSVHHSRKLMPEIKVMYDAHGILLKKPLVVDLDKKAGKGPSKSAAPLKIHRAISSSDCKCDSLLDTGFTSAMGF